MKRLDRTKFAQLARKGILLDGALGTELAKAGMPAGCCPEEWCLAHPEKFCAIQRNYCQAGSTLIYAPTFGCNRCKLAEFHLQDETPRMAEELVRISRKNVPSDVWIFGDIAPTGRFVEPYGDVSFEEAEQVYFESASAMVRGGADGFAIETMMDLQEARAAFLGTRRAAPDLPILVTMTFEASGRSLTGCSPLAALTVFQSLGADAFGCNCSTGPAEMREIIRQLFPFARIPLVAKPNAGLPKYLDGKTVFPMDAESFAREASGLREAGASLVGGCCGTTPEHLSALHRSLAKIPLPAQPSSPCGALVCSPSDVRELSLKAPFAIIGERINPTGKKALQAELRAGRLEMVREFALQQQEAGAALLDVNMGLSGICEAEMMAAALRKIVPAVHLPLCIDTTDPQAAEAALRLYPGRALFNSISAEKHRVEKILPIVAKYHAMPILLPVTDKGIPKTVEERIAVVQRLLSLVAEYGYSNQDVCVDPLIMTVSADANAAKLSLGLVQWCAGQGIATVCGLSNVSFGLPARRAINQTFLGMAAGCGLSAAIANPLFPEIMESAAAVNALTGKDVRQAEWIARNADVASVAQAAAPQQLSPEEQLRRLVLQGNSEAILPAVDALLQKGVAPMEIIDKWLIPAITEVGQKYEKKEFFLPQLMSSAEAMQKATAYLEPKLAASRSDSKKTKVVFATVRGDIHDIGKNIVIVMLRNYGFEVLDLGKDVPPETIIDAAVKNDAHIIALSALMTTTMHSMKETVELARARKLNFTFLVGGAVVDQEFAEEIGAIYTPDPMATVRACESASANL